MTKNTIIGEIITTAKAQFSICLLRMMYTYTTKCKKYVEK